MLHQLASTQLAGRSDKVPNMLPNGPSQMNDILRCLFFFPHPFLAPLLLFLLLHLLHLPSLIHSAPPIPSTNLAPVKLFPHFLRLALIIGAPVLLATFPAGAHSDRSKM